MRGRTVMPTEISLPNQEKISSDVPFGVEKKPLAERLQDAKEFLASLPQKTKTPYPSYEDFCLEDDKGISVFKPARVAKWLKEHEHFKTEISTEIVYYGDEAKGKWDLNGEIHLQEILSKILDEENRVCHYNNILHALKGLTYTDIIFSQKIACENGLLNVETGELSPFNLDEMAFYSIPTAYDPKADCAGWLEFLKQSLDPEDIPTIQEWAGYILLPDYRFHKMMWLHGGGRNGKGVWQRTIEGIIGKDNVAGVGLEEFDGAHRFALRQLYGKLFNPCSEPITSTKKALRTELLKKATGQDSISAECKGSDKRINFTNTAKITILANKFPTVKDDTIAFKERRLIIKFPNEFIGEKQIQNLEKAWLSNPEEKSGILTWMLQGLQRLLSQGYFTESKSQREIEIEFQRASDTIGAFLNELGTFGKNFVCTRQEAYIAYQNYCEVYGLNIEDSKSFTQRLEHTPKITKGRHKTERGWKGVSFKNLSEEENESEQQITLEKSMVKGTDGTVGAPLFPYNNCEESLKEGESKLVSQVYHVYSQQNSESLKRICSLVCINFRKAACPSANAFYRSFEDLVPLKCSGEKCLVNDGLGECREKGE
jgi:P4 family phage/plasmid primase-like protien